MKIKKGDQVQVITGKDKGKQGEVLKVLTKEQRVIVDGINIVKKHLKPSQINPDGGIVEKASPIHVSNVMVVDQKTKKPTRIGYVFENGQKFRVTKASNTKLGAVGTVKK